MTSDQILTCDASTQEKKHIKILRHFKASHLDVVYLPNTKASESIPFAYDASIWDKKHILKLSTHLKAFHLHTMCQPPWTKNHLKRLTHLKTFHLDMIFPPRIKKFEALAATHKGDK